MSLTVVKRMVSVDGFNPLTHWGRDKMDAISQTTYSNAFSWMKIFEFPIEISLKSILKGQINNIPAEFQIMAWRRPGDKPLSKPMTVSLLTHICVTQSHWVLSKGCAMLSPEVFNGRLCLVYLDLKLDTYERLPCSMTFVWFAVRKYTIKICQTFKIVCFCFSTSEIPSIYNVL